MDNQLKRINSFLMEIGKESELDEQSYIMTAEGGSMDITTNEDCTNYDGCGDTSNTKCANAVGKCGNSSNHGCHTFNPNLNGNCGTNMLTTC